jgi:hypothetical protein
MAENLTSLSGLETGRWSHARNLKPPGFAGQTVTPKAFPGLLEQPRRMGRASMAASNRRE